MDFEIENEIHTDVLVTYNTVNKKKVKISQNYRFHDQ